MMLTCVPRIETCFFIDLQLILILFLLGDKKGMDIFFRLPTLFAVSMVAAVQAE